MSARSASRAPRGALWGRTISELEQIGTGLGLREETHQPAARFGVPFLGFIKSGDAELGKHVESKLTDALHAAAPDGNLLNAYIDYTANHESEKFDAAVDPAVRSPAASALLKGGALALWRADRERERVAGHREAARSGTAGAPMNTIALDVLKREIGEFILFKRTLGRRYEAAALLLMRFMRFAEAHVKGSSKSQLEASPTLLTSPLPELCGR